MYNDQGLVMGEVDSLDANALIHWLMVEGPRQEDPSQFLHSFCLRLREAGIQVDRATLGAPLLHPVAQSSYVFWVVETGPSQRWFKYTPDVVETLKVSPIYPIYNRGEASSLRLDQPQDRGRYPVGGDLWAS